MPTRGRTEKPTICDHCGFPTYKFLIGEYTAEKNDGSLLYVYGFFQCEICNGPILEESVHSGGGVLVDQQLWPPPLRLSPEAPERVQEIYEEARGVMRSSPSSFVVQIGRALEAVATNMKAEGQNLNSKLNWLINEGHLPEIFGEMGHINRIYRNWGAHDAELEVDSTDVRVVDEFFKAIIEYIYVAPAKLEIVKSLIKLKQSNS